VASTALLPVDALMDGIDDLPPDTTYAPRQLLVEADSADTLVKLAEAAGYGLVLGRSNGPRGVLVVPEGVDLDDALGTVLQSAGITTASRNAILRGAGRGRGGRTHTNAADHSNLQWHLDQAAIPADRPVSGAIAVLDSGLAYRSSTPCWCNDYTETRAATSLDGLWLVDPWDYFDQDPYPDDAHGHGTHITSTIAASGEVKGAARGAAIIPYRVLDENNVGLEFLLVDALWWAGEMGATVVNMSLSFGPGYVPSAALTDQLLELEEDGVVLVAAAGNNGGMGATWPAASPSVIAVGASCGLGGDSSLHAAPYTQLGSDVDLLAPGGCLDEDANADDHPDGILAESFGPGSPTDLDLFWAQGTSQAAAIVSGAALRLRNDGVPPTAVREVLQASSVGLDDTSVPALDLASLDYATARLYADSPIAPAADHQVALLPWVEGDGHTLTPHAELVVLDGEGAPADGVYVMGHFAGTSESAFSCVTEDGACSVSGPATHAPSGAGGWTVTIGRVGGATHGRAPTAAMLLTPELDATIGAVADSLGALPPIGLELAANSLPGSVHGWSFSSTGSGITTSPFGVVLTDPLLRSLGSADATALNGAGITTSPFSLVGIDLGHNGGVDLLAVSGSGITTSPFGVLLGEHTLPAACLGTATCTTSVLSPATGEVTGSLGGASAAAVVFSGDLASNELAGSSAMLAWADQSMQMAAMSGAFKRLRP